MTNMLAVHSAPAHVEEEGSCEPDNSTIELLSPQPEHPEHLQENSSLPEILHLEEIIAGECV